MCIQNLYSQVYVRKRRYVTAMYINRNRIRKIIDRGNSLSPSARSCAPPRAEIFLYIFPSPPYFRWWPPIRNHIDRIKQYLDWREYLRAGFASGHGPASGSRRVLEEIRRTVAWEREREKGSVERCWKGDGATRRGARQTERERDGRHGTHTTNTNHGCVESVTRVLRCDPIYKVLPTRRRFVSRLGFSTDSSYSMRV